MNNLIITRINGVTQIATDAREKLTAQLSQITAALTVKEA